MQGDGVAVSVIRPISGCGTTLTVNWTFGMVGIVRDQDVFMNFTWANATPSSATLCGSTFRLGGDASSLEGVSGAFNWPIPLQVGYSNTVNRVIVSNNGGYIDRTPVTATFVLTNGPQGPAPPGTVTYASGDVSFAPAGSASYAPIKAGHQMHIGDTIRTGADGYAKVTQSDGTVLTLGPHSVYTWTSSTGPSGNCGSFLLSLGIAYVNDLCKETFDAGLAGYLVSAVRGTQYEVIVNQDNSTTIRVFQGSVQSTDEFNNSTLTIAAGQEATATYPTGNQTSALTSQMFDPVAVDQWWLAVGNQGGSTTTGGQNCSDVVAATVPTVEGYAGAGGVAYDPTHGYLYVSNTNSNQGALSVYSVGKILSNLSNQTNTFAGLGLAWVGGEPFGIAWDSANGLAYATSGTSATVYIVNGTETLGSIPVGRGPTGIVYDPMNGDLYVANTQDGTVSVISGSSGRVVSTVAAFRPTGSDRIELGNYLTVDSKGNVYVTDFGGGGVAVISPASNLVTGVIKTGDEPTGVAFNPTNGYLYVSQYGYAGTDTAYSVEVLTTNGTAVATIPVGSYPNAVLANPLDGDVYVANYGDSTVYVVSGSTNGILESIGVGSGPMAMAFDPADGYLFVANDDGNSVSVVKTCGALSPVQGTVPSRSGGTTASTSWLTIFGVIAEMVLPLLVIVVLVAILLLSRKRRRKKAKAAVASPPSGASGASGFAAEPAGRFCTSCGARAGVDEKFCGSCGAQLRIQVKAPGLQDGESGQANGRRGSFLLSVLGGSLIVPVFFVPSLFVTVETSTSSGFTLLFSVVGGGIVAGVVSGAASRGALRGAAAGFLAGLVGGLVSGVAIMQLFPSAIVASVFVLYPVIFAMLGAVGGVVGGAARRRRKARQGS